MLRERASTAGYRRPDTHRPPTVNGIVLKLRGWDIHAPDQPATNRFALLYNATYREYHYGVPVHSRVP